MHKYDKLDYASRDTSPGLMDASVNRGNNSRVKTKFQEDMPWLVFGWCMAHKLRALYSRCP